MARNKLHPIPHPPRTPLRAASAPDPTLPTLVLVTPEDCSLETVLPTLDVRAVAVADDLARNAWDRTALQDAAARAAAHWQRPTGVGDIASIAAQHGCTQVVTGFAPVGPVAKALEALRGQLSPQGIALAEHQREWDRLCWPHCGKGFFNLKSEIPRLLEALRLA